MALTTKEREALFTVQKDVALLVDWKPRQEETHEKLKFRVDSFERTLQNGLLSKVNALHEYMIKNEQEKLAVVKLDGDIKILGFKAKAETRQGVVIGTVAGLIQIVLFLLTKIIP